MGIDGKILICSQLAEDEPEKDSENEETEKKIRRAVSKISRERR